MHIRRKNAIALSRMTIFILCCTHSLASEPEQNENGGPEKSTDTRFVPLRKVPPPKLTPEQEYIQSIRRAMNVCQRSGGKAAECWSKGSPAKCEYLVYAALTEKGDKYKEWHLCASTCTSAGFWSRTFGECSTELTPIAESE